jgi:hypothetical protein
MDVCFILIFLNIVIYLFNFSYLEIGLMSGRLIILRHKKWHVWNRENIEKVKKDERLHREELEANSKKSRDMNAEHLMETLRQASDSSEIPHKTHSTEIVEYKVNRQAENEEYRREREEKELLQKRIEGSAPFALGEGSSEMKKIKPWYMENESAKKSGVETAVIGGKRLQGEAAVAALDRDMARKHAEDPMVAFMHVPNIVSDSQQHLVRNSEGCSDSKHSERRGFEQSSRAQEFPGFDHLSGFMGFSASMVEDDDTKYPGKHKKGSSKKNSKKDKKKKRCRNDSRSSSESGDDRKHRRKKHRKSSSEDKQGKSSSLSQHELTLLRERRMQREKNERIRESLAVTNK